MGYKGVRGSRLARFVELNHVQQCSSHTITRHILRATSHPRRWDLNYLASQPVQCQPLLLEAQARPTNHRPPSDIVKPVQAKESHLARSVARCPSF
jgi:hypothetical protein